jgi:hypothetical protein
MRPKLELLAVTFSVVLNLAFLGAYARERFGAHAAVAPVFEQLDLSNEQRREFEGHRREFLQLLSRLGGQLESAQLELIDLVAEHSPDRPAIATKQEEIRRLQGSIQSAVIEHLIQQGALLDEGRRARFFALLKARAEATGRPRPPWMRPAGTARPDEP